MLDATTTNMSTNANTHPEQSPFPLASTSYLCTSCHITFQNGQEQRIHMKEPWHVYNIKRRIASLEPISRNEFDTKIEKKIEVKETSTKTRLRGSDSDEDPSDSEDEQSASPFQCLFCSESFASDDDGFEENLEHMLAAHSMSIPDPGLVADLQSLVGYLATEVRTWHECIYCGATKRSTRDIQSHMRDKGHCLLNLDREPELLDFWEVLRLADEGVDEGGANEPEQERPVSLSETEMRFASGKVIGSRHAAPTSKRAFRREDLTESTTAALVPVAEDAEASQLDFAPQPRLDRQLARRDEMSIAGVSAQQRQALVLAEKKAQRSEAVARRAREWVNAKGANFQKFDQVDTKLKMGKQNHKLQPR